MNVRSIFISSTIDDLRLHRQEVHNAAIGSKLFPQMMEDWPAQPTPSLLQKCYDEVDKADALVVIVAHRYGWVPDLPAENDIRKSVTWLECERARSAGKPVLAFLVNDQQAWDDKLRESNHLLELLELPDADVAKKLAEVRHNIKALKEFKSWLCTLGIVKWFTTLDDLRDKVGAALRAWQAATPIDLTPDCEAPTDDPVPYLRSLYQRNSTIEVRGLRVGSGQASRFSIDSLYIPLTIQNRRAFADERRGKNADPEQLESKRVELDTALRSKHLAIIGDPGSGKSTFLRRFAFFLSKHLLATDGTISTAGSSSTAGAKSTDGVRSTSQAASPLGLDTSPFPMLITVASLAQHIKNCTTKLDAPTIDTSPAWLAHYCAARSVDAHCELSEDFFRAKLAAGDAIIMIDGLDEAASKAVREQVAAIVEEAAALFTGCRFVLTSRPAAFDDSDSFSAFDQVRIEPLENDAIEFFLHAWCAALFADGAAQAEEHREELLHALYSRPEIRRLARTPVMLTALAVVHWHEKRLPEQRADLYESILDWLARSREKLARRPNPERCISLLQKLAFAMQDHDDGRQVQVRRHWAARQIASDFREATDPAEQLALAEKFLVQEELDSGIVVARGDDIKFWHLTFQEYLAARAIAASSVDVRDNRLFGSEKICDPAWRETMLLLAGVLYHQGIDRVDAMISAVLDWMDPPTLVNRARVIGVLGGAVADLRTYEYQPSDPRYAESLTEVMQIFEPTAEGKLAVPIKDAIAAADALGQAGDPRLDIRVREENWIDVPGGTFQMGAQDQDKSAANFDDEAETIEAPVHTVILSPYRIARYPVTVDEYLRFVESGGYDREKYWLAGGFGDFSEPDDWEDQQQFPSRPVVGVSWFEAVAYATSQNCRLPTEAEWEFAARGSDGRKYPWGDDAPDENRINFAPDFDPNVGHPTPIGVYPLSRSPFGLDDLTGNVWEWCEDWFGAYKADSTRDPTGEMAGDRRLLRGGAWGDGDIYCRASCRNWGTPEGRGYNTGFRVVVGGQDSQRKSL